MEQKILNEFRQDLVSGDWVLFATGRSKRPTEISSNFEPVVAKFRDCPFDDPVASGQEIVKIYPSEKDWQIAVIKNKYPALVYGICVPPKQNGPFRLAEASSTLILKLWLRRFCRLM